MTNKTAVKEYHEHGFDNLLDILKKNKRKISIDPSTRDAQGRFEMEFTQSMSVLAPLKAKIETTDDLINEIVYRLYGLTKGETKIVKGEANLKTLG